MPPTEPVAGKKTVTDRLGLPDDASVEIVGGEIVEKAAPSGEHGGAQGAIVILLGGPFQRRPGGRGGPGGWWFATEVDIELEPHELYRPDVAGWRRESVPQRPAGRIVRVRPDWVCEILSPTTAGRDQVQKLRTYHRTGVDHYWIVSPEHETLTVYRWTADGYLAALTAQRGDHVRAEPFDAIEIPVGVLFGDDPDDESPRP